MQFVDRGAEPPPQTLVGSVPRMMRGNLHAFMQQRENRRAQSNPPSSAVNYSEGGMPEALKRLFKGRCAFCERKSALGIHLFRPAGEALPYAKSEHAHLYYCWLELAWQNFYPACASCMPDDPGYFPVSGKRAPIPDAGVFRRHLDNDNGLWPADAYPPREAALLLDPCQDKNFHQHLWIGLDGMLHGVSRRGSETINHFHLNADALVDARRQVHMEYLGKIRHALQNRSAKDVPASLFQFDLLEFGGTWYLLLRALLAEMAKVTGTRPSVSRAHIGGSLRRLCTGQNGFGLFDTCEMKLERRKVPPVPAVRSAVRRPGDARLVGVDIENFKSIEQLSLRLGDGMATTGQRTPALLILGENAAGKSSILEAIALALAGRDARAVLNIPDRQLILAPDHFGEFNVSPRRSASITLRLLENGQERQSTLHLGALPRGKVNSADEERIAVFAYGAFRKYTVRSPGGLFVAHIRNLFDASDLPNPERWLLGLADDRFAMVMRALRTIFAIDGEFAVIVRAPQERVCFLVTAVDAKGDPLSFVPLRTASSGFRSVLAMACDVMRGLMDTRINPGFESLHTARAVVLIDEIEAHLHPRWKIAIVSALRKALPQVTFIATTHDPLCLRGMGDDEVVVLRRRQLSGHKTVSGMRSQVEVVTDLPAASRFRIEQLLTSDLFQLDSTDDPAIEVQMAHMATLLAADTLDEAQRRAVEVFKREIAAVMPIGTSEAQRIVQEAVAEYLQERVREQSEQMAPRRERVKRRIIDALRGVS